MNKLFLILCVLLILPAASATMWDVSVSMPTEPTWYLIRYYPPETLVNYTINSSTSYTDVSWTLYGSYQFGGYLVLDRQEDIDLVAYTPRTFGINCPARFFQYYMNLSGVPSGGNTMTVSLKTPDPGDILAFFVGVRNHCVSI